MVNTEDFSVAVFRDRVSCAVAGNPENGYGTRSRNTATELFSDSSEERVSLRGTARSA